LNNQKDNPRNLHNDLKVCKEHIQSLLEASEILYNNNKYPIALSLSVLAHEELSKMKLVLEKIINNEILTKKEWNKLSKSKTHTRKLQGPYIDSTERMSKIGPEFYNFTKNNMAKLGYKPFTKDYDSAKMKNSSILKNFQFLNEIKKDSFHMRYHNPTLYVTPNTKQTKALAYLERITTTSIFYGFLHTYYQFQINQGKESPDVKKLRDEFSKEKDDISNEIKSDSFQKKRIIGLNFIKTYSNLFSNKS